jgi:DNA repair protein RecO (recombination protein O)
LGSKKIESKNGRNLFLGNFNEFQIFRARDINKLSKLKKTIVIKQIDLNLQNDSGFILLNECVYKMPPHTFNIFNFYEQHINLINEKKYSPTLIGLIVLMHYCKLLGLNLEVNRCVICGSKKLKTISLSKHGMLCAACFDKYKDKAFNIGISKLIHYLFNEKFDELNEYESYYLLTIDILKSYIKENLGIILTTEF